MTRRIWRSAYPPCIPVLDNIFLSSPSLRAIARSLQDTVVSTPSGSRHSRQQPHNRVSRTASPEVIEIESDDDDIEEINPPRKNSPKYSRDGSDSEQFAADLRAAIEASKAKAAPTSHSVASTAHSSSNTPHAPPTATSSAKESAAPHARLSSTNVFLLDRAQMERERLARQKRLRPDIVASKTTHDSTSEYEDDEDDEGERGIKRQRVSHSPVPKRGAPSSSNVQVIAGSSKAGRVEGSRSGDGLFFDGELRQTANKHTEPGKDTRPVFRLTDILAPVRLSRDRGSRCKADRSLRETRLVSLLSLPMYSTSLGSIASSIGTRR